MSQVKNQESPGLKSRVVIEAIDALRARKARPDIERITHWVIRRYGYKREEVVQTIQDSVGDGSVLRVKYKDSISYRNPAKVGRSGLRAPNSSQPRNAPLNASKRVMRIVRQITMQPPASSEGASPALIWSALIQQKQFGISDQFLAKILKHLTQLGTLKLLPTGNFLMAGVGGKSIIRKTTVQPQIPNDDDGPVEPETNGSSETEEPKTVSLLKNSLQASKGKQRTSDVVTGSGGSSSSKGAKRKGNVEPAPVAATTIRARPISKRKKFKKNLGPDFLEPSDLGMAYLQNSFDPKCEVCGNPQSQSEAGVHEEFLICKDCNYKAHPSCLSYSQELTSRCRMNPWQCVYCKTCTKCHDMEGKNVDSESMLLCDMCDRGYHMECHKPPILEKPSGSWICNSCLRGKKGSRDADSDLGFEDNDEVSVSCDSRESHTSSCEELIINKRSDNLQKVFMHLKPSVEEMVAAHPEMGSDPKSWSVDDVETFICFIGYPEPAEKFKEQEVDGISLLLMTRNDVLNDITPRLGPAIKIYGHIQRLQTINA